MSISNSWMFVMSETLLVHEFRSSSLHVTTHTHTHTHTLHPERRGPFNTLGLVFVFGYLAV